jgi:hypothetical protein
MHNDQKHKVRTHTWQDGILQTLDYLFETVEEAVDFSSSISASAVKVFNTLGEVVESRTMPNTPHELEKVGYSYNEYFYPGSSYA